MKIILTATALLAMTTAAYATDLGSGFSSDSQIKYDLNTETSVYTLTFSPEVEYSSGAMTLEIGSDVDMRDVDFTGMDMTLGYDIANIPGLEVFGKVTTDDEWNMGDIHVGATFSF